MTIREIIQKLANMGFKIEYKQRYERLSESERKKAQKIAKKKDKVYEDKIYARGIRITSIDGIKYSGSVGNRIAREMLDTQLSQRQQEQLQRIRTPRAEPLPEDLVKRIRSVQARARRLRKKGQEKVGSISTKQVRNFLKEYGRNFVENELSNIERRQKKLVPTWLWQQLQQQFEINYSDYLTYLNEDDVTELYNLIMSNDGTNVRYEDYEKLRYTLYDINLAIFSDEISFANEAIKRMLEIARRLK